MNPSRARILSNEAVSHLTDRSSDFEVSKRFHPQEVINLRSSSVSTLTLCASEIRSTRPCKSSVSLRCVFRFGIRT